MEISEEPQKPKKKNTATKIYKNPSNYTFNCECGKNFNYKKHYNDHRRRVHKDHSDSRKEPPVKPQKSCPLCDFKSKYRDEMVKHIEDVHNIALTEESFCFPTKELFLEWKNKIEHETTSKYISENGSQAFRKHVITKYTCHRSGYYLPHKKKGLRHLKKQGSIKINAFCPANITLKLKNNGSCIVFYIGTHVGHDNNLKYLSLTPSERENIARKLSLKIPFDEILDNIRDSSSESSTQRIHLLTRKDLYNIQASYNLTSKGVKHKNDSASVDAWVKQIQSEEVSILYYKPQGNYSEQIPELKSEDFVLIIMTEAQLDLLTKYGHDCICINGTHGVNCYDFELFSIMVLDELREGFPCAFLISNRSDVQILSLFFTQIKLRAGLIKPKIFMSDLSDNFFNAWSNVMGLPEKRLYCSWHVDHCWRENLSKIKTRETQSTVYKHLRTLLIEHDVNTFQKMLIQFWYIDDPECLEFISYFRNNFVNNIEYWAYCHRLHAGINTNMYLERMHKSINFIYLKEKKLDKGIAAIMKFVREKLADTDVLKANTKGKICGKMANITLRHKNMEDMDVNSLKTYDHGWEVLSEDGFEMYLVQRQEATCNDCQLVCAACETCIHQFVCTCLDSAIKYNMCKHIHMVAKSVKDQQVGNFQLIEVEGEIEGNDNDDCGADDNVIENDETFLGELNHVSTNPDLDVRKEKLIKSIIDTVNSISSIEELQIIENKFASASSALLKYRNATLTELKHVVSNTQPAKPMAPPPEIDLEQQLMGHKIKRDYFVTNDPEQPFVCSICMRGFKKEGYLHSHIVTHSDEKKALCEECGKGFHRRDQLMKHARFHRIKRAKEEEQMQLLISKDPLAQTVSNRTRTTHVTISVDGVSDSQIQIPVQIPVGQHLQMPKEEPENILSL